MPDITDTYEVAEERGDEEARSNMVASDEEKPSGISFHVQMRSWTADDMQDLIVDAAATKVVGRCGDKKLAKLIEQKAIDAITARADEKLADVAKDVLGTTLTPKGYEQKSPITIGEAIGMLGREYLEQVVSRDGKVCDDYYSRQSGVKRIEHFVRSYMDHKFKNEIEAATNAAIAAVRAEIKARHEQLLAAERARFAEALAKL